MVAYIIKGIHYIYRYQKREKSIIFMGMKNDVSRTYGSLALEPMVRGLMNPVYFFHWKLLTFLHDLLIYLSSFVIPYWIACNAMQKFWTVPFVCLKNRKNAKSIPVHWNGQWSALESPLQCTGMANEAYCYYQHERALKMKLTWIAIYASINRNSC